MLEAVGICLTISPRKRRLMCTTQKPGNSFATTPLKPHVERLLEQSNDVEANPGPLPHRLVRAHSGAQVRGGGRQRSLAEEQQQEMRSRREQEMDRATLPRPHVPRLLEQANDIECNPGPLPHRLVSRAPNTPAQQARGRVYLLTLSPFIS